MSSVYLRGPLVIVIYLQERLVAGHGVQCGFCSPGMVMSMFGLLRNNPEPSELEIEDAVKGSYVFCRSCNE
jgi:xanthine dehydrogenase/oxidase